MEVDKKEREPSKVEVKKKRSDMENIEKWNEVTQMIAENTAIARIKKDDKYYEYIFNLREVTKCDPELAKIIFDKKLHKMKCRDQVCVFCNCLNCSKSDRPKNWSIYPPEKRCRHILTEKYKEDIQWMSLHDKTIKRDLKDYYRFMRPYYREVKHVILAFNKLNETQSYAIKKFILNELDVDLNLEDTQGRVIITIDRFTAVALSTIKKKMNEFLEDEFSIDLKLIQQLEFAENETIKPEDNEAPVLKPSDRPNKRKLRDESNDESNVPGRKKSDIVIGKKRKLDEKLKDDQISKIEIKNELKNKHKNEDEHKNERKNELKNQVKDEFNNKENVENNQVKDKSEQNKTETILFGLNFTNMYISLFSREKSGDQ